MPSLNEIPVSGSKGPARGPIALSRRRALSLLATGIASGLAGCSKPVEQIIPYVKMPARVVPGEPLSFATTLSLSGYGRGVLVTSIDGRPIKVAGNPLHPASAGATDVFSEAAILSLYDPDRSRVIIHENAIASPDSFRQALADQLAMARRDQGETLRLLTGRITSPTLLRQIDDLLTMFPRARWHAYDPLNDDHARAGAELAFGHSLDSLPDLSKVHVLVTLDADPLGHGPDQVRNARGFSARRKPQGDKTLRIYSAETLPTLTGSKADHRLALAPSQIGEFAVALARALGADVREPALPDHATRIAQQAAVDLSSQPGASLVLAGRTQTPEIHAIVYWINAKLKAPLSTVDIGATPSGRRPETLKMLADDLAAEKAKQLIMIGTNPVYDASADLEFAKLLQKATFSLHLGCYFDETATLSGWHLPQAHPLESWSDLRATDGTASLVQPLIHPLFGGRSEHELLALMLGREASAYDLVRATWQSQIKDDFEAWWTRALHDGVIANSAAAPVPLPTPKLPELPAAYSGDALAVVLQPDPSVWDGSFANNAWLQECPKPLTKQVWGNALALNPTDAHRLGIKSGDLVFIVADRHRVEVPVQIDSGVAPHVAGLTLGYGRTDAGAIGNGVGANAYAIRPFGHPWTIPGARIEKTGRRSEILTTQNVVRSAPDLRELYPRYDLPQKEGHAEPSHAPSLLPEVRSSDGGHAWGMVIDTAVCIGCNACLVSCQAENNVAVVGPEEVARGRDMHWLRIDVYDLGSSTHPDLGFQPVPCMHCELAPCEPVCPVAASVHDSEGLNLQVYNRCVGTRFCEANCPYKVRRFNFFGYADGEEYANLGFESYKAQKNPDVTVRARGVMEKCTYCVQRIGAARRDAEREHRAMRLDEVKTACQSACPTSAITFGDFHQSESAVNQAKADPRHYTLLEHLGTRPRTTYLADLRNPVPSLDETET